MVSARRRTVPVALGALLLAACGGGGGGGDDSSAAGPAEPVTAITITSTDLSFDIESFAVPVGEEVALTYENDHDGVPHNVHVDTGEADEPTTEVAEGPVTQELTFTLDEAGEVDYLCDIHPATMRGTITAEDGGAP